MKSFVLLGLSFLLLNSCVEREIEAYDSLTPDEQAEIRTRGRQLCLDRLTPVYEDFKRKSNEVFVNTGYDRGKGFTYKFSGGTVNKSLDVKIWKRTSSALYFYISAENADDYFLKISLAENSAMIDSLLDTHCLRPEIYISNLDSSALTMTLEYVLPKAPNTEKYKDTYRMPFTSLAAFANYRITRTRGTFDVDDKQIDTTVKYESTMTSKDFTFNSTDPTSNEFNQKFCLVFNDSGKYRFQTERGEEGFKLICSNTADPAIWNLGI